MRLKYYDLTLGGCWSGIIKVKRRPVFWTFILQFKHRSFLPPDHMHTNARAQIIKIAFRVAKEALEIYY